METSHLILIFEILYVVTAVGLIIIIISENRNPVKTISWVLLLIFLPLVGLIIYYFFGEDKRRKRLISNKILKKISRNSFIHKNFLSNNQMASEYRGLPNLAYKLQKSILYSGNDVQFYTEGQDKFEALIDEIEKAQNYIHFQYYVFNDDQIGCKIKDALIKKARQGVSVCVIYDDVGSWRVKRRFYKEMKTNGIQVKAFLKVTFKILTSRVNYRNHRKVVVVDGRVGFVGGMNIADRYIQGINGGVWRDCHTKIAGPAVAGLEVSFLIDWYSVTKEALDFDAYFPEPANKGTSQIQFVTSGPIGRFRNILLCFLHAISNAKETIYIQTPYFIPNEALLNAIQSAAMRGVDVRLMVPRKSDTRFVHFVTQSYLKELMEASVKVYLFDEGFLHSKVMIIDDDLVITGSANMDIRSFEHNFEISAFLYDQIVCEKAKQFFYTDMNSSSLLKLKEWNKRSRIKKFVESLFRLFSPLL